MSEHDIVIDSTGTIRFVYADDVAEIFAGEPDMVTTRASHVEPAFAYGITGAGWVADMRPRGGPILLGEVGLGFTTRQEALDAEREWLRQEEGL